MSNQESSNHSDKRSGPRRIRTIDIPPPPLPPKDRYLQILRTTVLENPWIKTMPHPKQANFLACEALEVLYGGAAGGGKSEAILMAALQYIDCPGYAAIIFRKTLTDLLLPGALLDRSKQWLIGTSAIWDEKRHTWQFPSGATLSFGYLEHENHKYRYQSTEFQFIGMDELTQFTESQYTYLFSRLRKRTNIPVPLRMRSASNPGGVGHAWVYERFIKNPSPDRVFIPATLEDNPSIEQEEYIKSLDKLDAVTRAQLLYGDWSTYEGGRFEREWFNIITDEGIGAWIYDEEPICLWDDCVTFMVVDPAISQEKDSSKTAIGVFSVTHRSDLVVRYVMCDRYGLHDLVPVIMDVASIYKPFFIGIEQSGFQMALVSEVAEVCENVYPIHPRGRTKLQRSMQAILMASSGNIYVVDAPWTDDFLVEVVRFSGNDKEPSDQVDILSYAVRCLYEFDLSGKVRTAPVIALGSGGEKWNGLNQTEYMILGEYNWKEWNMPKRNWASSPMRKWQ